MIARREDSPLYQLANPKSIAFFGASSNVIGMGTNQLQSILSMGFKGAVYPVHPREESVMGLKAYPDVADLPEVPDLAVLVLPTKVVNQTLTACGRKGIRRAVVVSGGFKEVGGPGVELEKELSAICRQYGIRLLGPNCLGVLNTHQQLNTTFIPFEGFPGFIGLASQSGSFITQMFDYINRLGLGFSTAFSVGNEVDVDVVDCLEYLGACPETKVIALYLEGIKRGREFVRVARRISLNKPIVAYYVGGSEMGRKAGLSHTGALAGPDRLYDGIFRQSGVVRAQSIAELFDYCWALGTLPQPRGASVVIQTNSGGPGAAAADACGRSGLTLPALSAETLEKLAPFVPNTGSINNPVDLTFSKNPLDFYSAIPEVLIADKNIDLLMLYFLTPVSIFKRTLKGLGTPEERLEEETSKYIEALVQAVLDLFHKTDKPMLGYSWRGLDEQFNRGLIEGGLPVFPDAARAAKAAAAAVLYGQLKENILAGEKAH